MDVIDTNDENPLQHSIPSIPQLQSKTSGRPRKNEKTIFSSPPRSIVSLLLRKTMNDKTIIIGNSYNNSVSYENNVPKSERKFKEWVCRRCSFRTDNKESLKEHKATHKNKLHQCDFTNCKYSTKFSSNLIKHQRTHTAEKPYICDKCLFRTNFQNSLTVHKRIHTLEKPYACQNCKYRCNSSSNLKKHCSHRHANVSNKRQH